MFWSTAAILFLFVASVNSQSNWFNKVNIVKNGQNYINIYAFSEMEFIMDTLDAKYFNLTIKNGCPVNHIEFTLSTASASTTVLCIADKNRIICKPSPSTPPHDPVVYRPSLNDANIDLYSGYNDAGLNFLKEGQKYLLKISSNVTPADDQNLCPFLMEWPSTVTLEDKHENAEESAVPINYEICEEYEKCDGLENGGIKFVRKGTLEFTIALLNNEKEYNILHSSGLNSPIFTIHASTFCTEFTTKISFINLGSILFKKDSGKIDIETDFKPVSQNVRDIPIANDSDVNFYFYKNYVYCSFFDLQNKFQMRTLKLPEEMLLKNQGKSTNIQIDYKSTVKECNETLKLTVGNNVKLLLPKTDAFTSTIEPSNSTFAENATKEKNDKTETASFPLGAIIAISCIGGILLLGCLALIIYFGIKKYRKIKNTKTLTKKTSDLLSISEMEKKMLSKKKPNKKSKKNKNPKKKTEEEFSIVYGKPTESFAPINTNGENEKVDQQKNMQQKNLDEKIIKQKSVREKIEKMKKKYGAQQNHEEKNTTEDGEEVEGKMPDKIIVTKSKTKTETVEDGGATQTTQNSVQASKNSTSEHSKPPNKKSVLKAKTKTLERGGTAPTQASVTAENPES